VLQDGIQRVLLALTLNLSSKISASDVCRAMSIYCFFVSLLLKDFKTGLCGGTEFILRTVLHTLISTLVRHMSSFFTALCQQCLVISVVIFSSCVYEVVFISVFLFVLLCLLMLLRAYSINICMFPFLLLYCTTHVV